MTTRRVARRYARGLFTLDEGKLGQARTHAQMLGVIKELFDERDAGKILRSPVMPPELKRELLTYGLQKAQADQLVTNLVNAMLEAGRVDVLPDVAAAFQELIDEAEGIAKAEVVSAVQLNAADIEAIGASIGRILKKRVEIQPVVDPSLLGGFVARIGNYRIDMSLKTKLDGLAQAAAQDTFH